VSGPPRRPWISRVEPSAGSSRRNSRPLRPQSEYRTQLGSVGLVAAGAPGLVRWLLLPYGQGYGIEFADRAVTLAAGLALIDGGWLSKWVSQSRDAEAAPTPA